MGNLPAAAQCGLLNRGICFIPPVEGTGPATCHRSPTWRPRFKVPMRSKSGVRAFQEQAGRKMGAKDMPPCFCPIFLPAPGVLWSQCRSFGIEASMNSTIEQFSSWRRARLSTRQGCQGTGGVTERSTPRLALPLPQAIKSLPSGDRLRDCEPIRCSAG